MRFHRLKVWSCICGVMLPTWIGHGVAWCAFAASFLAVPGCMNRAPSVSSPNIDAGAATAKAYEIYDSNGDGLLDAVEVLKCPAVADNMALYDVSGDKQVSRDEFEARVAAWAGSPAMMTVNCRVTLDGRPLAGAEVKFSPEPYLSDWLHEAAGTTSVDGETNVGISPALLPEAVKRVRAVNAGAYRISVTSPQKVIPARYNSATTIGKEVSAETRTPAFNIELKSK